MADRMNIKGVKVKFTPRTARPTSAQNIANQEIVSLTESYSIASNERLQCTDAIDQIYTELKRVLLRFTTQKDNIPPAGDKKEWQKQKRDIDKMVCLLKNEIGEKEAKCQSLINENTTLKQAKIRDKSTPETQAVVTAKWAEVKPKQFKLDKLPQDEAATMVKLQQERNDLHKLAQVKDREIQHLSNVISEMGNRIKNLEESHKEYERKSKQELLDEQERGCKQSEISKIVQRDALEQIKTLEASKELIQNDFETTQIKCATVESELEEFKRKQSLKERQMEDERKENEKRIKANEAVMRQFEKKRSKYTQQIGDLNANVKKLQSKHSKEIESLNKEIEAKSQKLETYKHIIEQNKLAKDELEKRINQQTTSLEEKDNVIQCQKSALEEKDARYHKLETSSENQLKKCTETIQQQHSELENKVSHISKMETAIAELQKEKRTLRIKKQSLNTQLQKSRGKAKEDNGNETSESCELARIKSALEVREREYTELFNQLDEMKQNVSENENENRDKLADQRKETEINKAELEQKTETEETHFDPVEEANERIREMEKSHSAQLVREREQTDRFKELSQSATREHEQLKSQIQRLQQELDGVRNCDDPIEKKGELDKQQQQEITACQTQIEAYKDEIKKNAVDIEKLQRDLDTKEQRCKELSKQWLVAEDDNNVTKKEQEKRIKDLTFQKDDLAAKHTQLIAEIEKDLKNRKQEVETLVNERAEQQKQIENMKRELSNEKLTSETYLANNAELERQIVEIKQQLKGAKDSSDTQATERAGLKDQIENLKKDLGNEQRNAKRLASESQEDKKEISDLKARVKELNIFRNDQERATEEIRKEEYNRGQNEGYLNGLMQTSQDTEKLNTSLSEERRKKDDAQKQLIQSEETLRQTVSDLQNERKANDTYKTQLRLAQQEIAQLKVKPKVPDNQYRIEELEQQLAIKESKFEHEINMLQTEHKRLQEVHRALAAENTRNVNSLAAEMNAKVSSDESALENISIQARPMKIAKDYTLLMSNFWLDAKSVLDDVKADDITEAGKVMFLFDILIICEQEAKMMHKQIVKELAKTLRNPLQRLVSCESKGAVNKEPQQQEVELPQNVLTVIGDYFRSLAHKVDLNQIRQRVEAALQTKYSVSDKPNTFISTTLQLEDVSEFITESIGIAWKMALQRPPMIFDVSQIGRPWHKGSHLELIWGSEPNAENAVIQYYKGPTLLHAGNTMVKGSVFVHNNKNPK